MQRYSAAMRDEDENAPSLPTAGLKPSKCKCLFVFFVSQSMPSHSECSILTADKLMQLKERNSSLAKENSELRKENGHYQRCMVEIQAELALSQATEFHLRKEVLT